MSLENIGKLFGNLDEMSNARFKNVFSFDDMQNYQKDSFNSLFKVDSSGISEYTMEQIKAKASVVGLNESLTAQAVALASDADFTAKAAPKELKIPVPNTTDAEITSIYCVITCPSKLYPVVISIDILLFDCSSYTILLYHTYFLHVCIYKIFHTLKSKGKNPVSRFSPLHLLLINLLNGYSWYRNRATHS